MHFKMSSAFCSNVDQSEILLSDNGLINKQTKTFGLDYTEIIHRRQSVAALMI